MSKITFANLKNIQEFQFFTDSSGVVLTQDGALYQFVGNQASLIKNPSEFTPSHLYFASPTHGAVIGNTKSQKEKPDAFSAWETWAFLGGTLIAFVFLFMGLNFLLKKLNLSKALRILVSVLGSLSVFAAIFVFVFDPFQSKQDWKHYTQKSAQSPHITTITSQKLEKRKKGYESGHHFAANVGQLSFIAFTQDGGKTWQTEEVPSNFELSALTFFENQYFVGTYASPTHVDGDIWIYADSLGKYSRVAKIDPSRAINGFEYASDGSFFVFGTEAEPTFPADEFSGSVGNIVQINKNLQAPYSLINAPDSAAVLSLSKADDNTLWVVLDNKAYNREGGFKKFDSKRLYQLQTNGEWKEIEIEGEKSFQQIIFIPNTASGYALSEKGKVFQTENSGQTWKTLDFEASKMALFQNKVIFLQNGNEFLVQ